MADATNNTKKPSINITRGKKKTPRSKRSTRSEPEASSSWFDVPGNLVSGVREVWLAGLGAFSVVEDQGTKLFRALVQEGKSWEQKQRAETEKVLKAAEKEGEQVAEATKETLNKQVLRRVRSGVDTALDRAGVPTRTDLEDLQAQVDALAQKADRLAAQLDDHEKTSRAS